MDTVILAIVIGGAFGFVLDRVGATNPDYIVGMLRLSKLHLMKTILFAIGFSSILLFTGLLAGIIDPGHLSVKGAYVGVAIGGVLLGFGFALIGYCPGTSLTALATGRKDAFFFALGGLGGAAAYMVSYNAIKATGILEPIVGGKATLGTIAGAGYPSVMSAISGEAVGIILGVIFIVIAALLPERLKAAP
jgi:hypothetical protein